MQILVTGPDGFLGTAVCSTLRDHGFFVRGAQWKAFPLTEGCESVVVGDINAQTDWSAALEQIDTVVHLAARVHVMDDPSADPLEAFRSVNVAGTQRLAQAAVSAGVKRFVFISSIKVNGEETAKGEAAFSETDEPAPVDPYGISKWEAEKVLRKIEAESDLEVVVLRPPLLYGPGVKANFLKLIQWVEKGIPLPLGGIENQRSLLGLTNFSDLILQCCIADQAAGHTFLVSDGDDVSSGELVKRIAKALGKPPRLVSIPESAIKLAGGIVGKSAQVQRLCSSLRINSSNVRSILNWQPPCTMGEEPSQVVVWFEITK
jgi:nucleoside-diphosphate-sugar epimerase